MTIETLYEASATATGGRDGRSTSSDGKLDVTLSTPKELGGPGGDGTNPEQLFAAGYAACYLNAMKFITIRNKSNFPADASVTAKVGIGPSSATGYGLSVELEVSLPGFSRTDAEDLAHKADAVCPYSNAVRNNIDVKISLV